MSESKTRRAVEFTARENTWSNQRRKRREESKRPCQPCDADQSPESKKMKVEDGHSIELAPKSSDNATATAPLCLKCLLAVTQTNESLISLQIQWIEGGLGRESVNQILQYLKNHLFDK